METCSYIRIKKYNVDDYSKYYLTVDLNDLKTDEEIFNRYKELYDYIYKNDIKVVFEKAFGCLEFKKVLLGFRDSFLKNISLCEAPFSYIEGAPIRQSPISSVVIFGISTDDNHIQIQYKTDIASGRVYGTVLKISDVRYLYLLGLIYEDINDYGTYTEYSNLFGVIEEYIKNCGFSTKDIVRTWIYLDNIFENYCNLNLARKEFFEQNGIDYSTASNDLPASTCIGGKSSDKATLTIDAYCIDKSINPPLIKRMYNKYQNEAEGKAYQFKPTFSRAVLIEDAFNSEIQISGTASVNETGETAFLDDAFNQIKKTLLNVNALLEQKNMTFDDICISTCFFKEKDYYKYYLEALEELNICNFSNTFVIGDVCRSNLLFELDGIAIKKSS